MVISLNRKCSSVLSQETSHNYLYVMITTASNSMHTVQPSVYTSHILYDKRKILITYRITHQQ